MPSLHRIDDLVCVPGIQSKLLGASNFLRMKDDSRTPKLTPLTYKACMARSTLHSASTLHPLEASIVCKKPVTRPTKGSTRRKMAIRNDHRQITSNDVVTLPHRIKSLLTWQANEARKPTDSTTILQSPSPKSGDSIAAAAFAFIDVININKNINRLCMPLPR